MPSLPACRDGSPRKTGGLVLRSDKKEKERPAHTRDACTPRWRILKSLKSIRIPRTVFGEPPVVFPPPTVPLSSGTQTVNAEIRPVFRTSKLAHRLQPPVPRRRHDEEREGRRKRFGWERCSSIKSGSPRTHKNFCFRSPGPLHPRERPSGSGGLPPPTPFPAGHELCRDRFVSPVPRYPVERFRIVKGYLGTGREIPLISSISSRRHGPSV